VAGTRPGGLLLGAQETHSKPQIMCSDTSRRGRTRPGASLVPLGHFVGIVTRDSRVRSQHHDTEEVTSGSAADLQRVITFLSRGLVPRRSGFDVRRRQCRISPTEDNTLGPCRPGPAAGGSAAGEIRIVRQRLQWAGIGAARKAEYS